ncbi:DnaB-like helicase C-terminal domain-containing protein [Nocardia asiatica]|uniref:DnaB-like helicase C-terminal domain-containing protein n=1 Tax=Nocardia asiatica TaxID=209252 RepID=UPI0014617011|nr:DnaB-like helicase C-terminal domain-containing protein [Nocardia asiatica]
MPASTDTPGSNHPTDTDGSGDARLAPASGADDTAEAAEIVGGFLDEMLQPTLDEIDIIASSDGRKPTSIPTGFADLDYLAGGGLAWGSLAVVAGHPGVGCSTLALQFARCAAIKHGIPAAYVVLDSTPQAVTLRLLSAETAIPHRYLQTGRLSDEEWTTLAHRMSLISEAPIAITRPEDRDVAAVSRFLRRLIDKHDIRLIVIDSLHLLTARTGLPYENREREVSEITRKLKALALDTDTAIVATAQVSTNPGPRQPFPMPISLADLRDSGSIAHVADYVILLDRPDAWERDHPRGGEADLYLAKNRFGPTAVTTVAHLLHVCRYADMAHSEPPQETVAKA